MRRSAAVAVIAAVAAVFVAGDAFAHKSKGYKSNSATNQRAWGAGVNQNPWNFPNCFVWSPRHRYWVWICGPPYPKEMPHR